MRQEALILVGSVALLSTIYLWADRATVDVGDLHRAPGDPASERVAVLRDAPPVPRNGSYVRSGIDADGTIHVTQWIRSRRGIHGLTIALPIASSGTSPAASDLRLVDGTGGDQRPVGPVGSSPAVVSFLVPVHVVRLSYVLTGTVTVSPSAPGRALADPVSLEVDPSTGARGPRTVEVTGTHVLNLACGSEAGTELEPCGRPGSDGWSTTLRATEHDRVVAQLDFGP
ncbi:hypothetical protein [Nocardioides mangrovi]|uniref:Uncharacterized protein n=1 Tax=Nocardioides mangrovi TaxID=2874580 RepID=A0ABS7UDU1_9ACTN|nr:hypothetical protein [Nocardioides mangrovi]MBZ5738876.1 hypothetical protein [Nocardioides mangrovi]